MSPGPAAAPPVPAVPPAAMPVPGRPGADAPSGAPAPGRGVWRIGWLPRSLAARTAIFLLLALMLVQAAGLLIHALDRVDLQRF
ncbi:MAG: two-component sensor histidine kinase, partial [Ancylobacter novellus]